MQAAHIDSAQSHLPAPVSGADPDRNSTLQVSRVEIAPGDAEDNVDSHELQLMRKLEHPHICAALASKTRIVVEAGQVLH